MNKSHQNIEEQARQATTKRHRLMSKRGFDNAMELLLTDHSVKEVRKILQAYDAQLEEFG